GIVGPASAQFFNFGGFGGPPQRQAPQRGGGWFGGDFFQPFQQQAPQQTPRQDFSRAPGPAKRDTVPERNVLVLGDAMADWLGYGLEDAYAEQPDMGVIRKHKTASGLIKYQPRGEPADWTVAAKAILAPEKGARSGGGLYEFRDERWVELYAKKIEELIGVLKSKGVPVLWVGLPAIRGQKGTSDMLFLDALYRDGAGKAGITYIDIWDGFVDEAGRFLQKGPDFEGQIRQLRTADGVFFTKPGARKLAHYVEREVTRLLASRSGPIAVPKIGRAHV